MKAKRILAAAVTLTMVFGAAGSLTVNSTVFGTGIAASAETVYTKKYGENVKWEYDAATGTITFSGEGDMWPESDHDGEGIWDAEGVTSYEWLLNVKNIVIEDGITSISAGAFSDSRLKNVENIEIPSTVNDIGINAFDAVNIWRNAKRAENNGMVIVNDMLVDASYDISALVIPEGVAKISAGALFYSDISSIVVPESCDEICENALPKKSLKYITILNPEIIIRDNSEMEKTIRSSYSSGSGSEFSGKIFGYADSSAQEYARDYCEFSEIEENMVSTASFDINYGGLSYNKAIVVPTGAEIEMPDVPKTPAYMKFEGWKLNDDKYNIGDSILLDEDKTFTAQWNDTREKLDDLNVKVTEPVPGEALLNGAAGDNGIRVWYVELKSEEYYDDKNVKRTRWDTVNHEGAVEWNCEVAEPNTVCTAKFNIQGSDIYRIADDTQVLVNGRKASIKATGIDNTYECTVKFVIGEKEESSSKSENSSKPDSSKRDSSEPEKPTVVLGDVNNDGQIDIEDAVMVINHVNGAKALTDDETLRANVDGNTSVDIEDAVAIISHVNGIKSLS